MRDPDDRRLMVWRDTEHEVEDTSPFDHDLRPIRFASTKIRSQPTRVSVRFVVITGPITGPSAAGGSRCCGPTARRTCSPAPAPTPPTRGSLPRTGTQRLNCTRVPPTDSPRRPYALLRTIPEGASVRPQQDGTSLLLEVPEHTGTIPSPGGSVSLCLAYRPRGGCVPALVSQKSTHDGYSFSGATAILYAVRFQKSCAALRRGKRDGPPHGIRLCPARFLALRASRRDHVI